MPRKASGGRMPAHYRVVLHGFSELERTALTRCFRHASTREPRYVQVDLIAESDFVVADAADAPSAADLAHIGRLGDTLFIGDQAHSGAGAHLPLPIDPERILRALDRMAARRDPGAHVGRPDILLPLDAFDSGQFPLTASEIADTAPAAFRHEPELSRFSGPAPLAAEGAQVQSVPAATVLPGEIDAAAPPMPAATPATAARAVGRVTIEPPDPSRPAKPVRLDEAGRAAAKADARKASRHARLAQAGSTGADAPRDVLVLDLAPEAVALSSLLTAFGFLVHRADSIGAAMSVLERTPLAAAFLDLAAQDVTGIDALDLCRRVKRQKLPLAGPVPAVMLVSGRDSAAARVRARLAHCDAFLTRPVTRGAVARALEACNVALPADARRT